MFDNSLSFSLPSYPNGLSCVVLSPYINVCDPKRERLRVSLVFISFHKNSKFFFCVLVKGKGQKDNSEKEREKGFWTCAKELERFLQCNLSGENKKPLLEGVRQHLHNYARQNLKETAWVNSEHNPKKTRSPTSEQRPSVLTDTAMNEVALNHNLLFRKICMDFLKNNAEFFSGGS